MSEISLLWLWGLNVAWIDLTSFVDARTLDLWDVGSRERHSSNWLKCAKPHTECREFGWMHQLVLCQLALCWRVLRIQTMGRDGMRAIYMQWKMHSRNSGKGWSPSSSSASTLVRFIFSLSDRYRLPELWPVLEPLCLSFEMFLDPLVEITLW